MEYMLDTLNLEAIKKWSKILPLAGVTSNPTIAKAEGQIDFFERIKEVRSIIGDKASIHVQVVAKDYEGILKDAAEIRRQAGDSIFVKVPVTTEGLAAIKTLKADGYHITATAIYTTFQGLLAIETGADYLAPYYNRMENLNIDAEAVIGELAEAIDRECSDSKILAASFKNVGQVNKAFSLGAQAITAGPDVFEAGFAMPSIQKAVDDFGKDWESTHHKDHI
ncbi:fructose-6-phosphate aldolase [Streptococcus parauberis]|uniref:fructose-6-phosphate aldolase n=1 Tax=Streptococcus parauberis TaxID=1348 RepID=UPI000789B8B7|nr:fructose-6-phosphate aldolase [Streptococcus parauberis]KYP17103.1 Fructose-6-phosphate aldolase 1 [Streptococcus parauberis]KYP17261.1 Fructose-6-phosphate aldolase 1 [Streptococcus parauberis]KYP17336.1 Fructose-6-phosphate aldolase 1 [Streptococcus parauberis]KYP23953.1 Fructose-6-phosphate aldolase 1 [Streptococcus parauberis]KYP25558.1 Fructose-6-phosphate aldolase 1 [Streptococcus parauberis]